MADSIEDKGFASLASGFHLPSAMVGVALGAVGASLATYFMVVRPRARANEQLWSDHENLHARYDALDKVAGQEIHSLNLRLRDANEMLQIERDLLVHQLTDRDERTRKIAERIAATDPKLAERLLEMPIKTPPKRLATRYIELLHARRASGDEPGGHVEAPATVQDSVPFGAAEGVARGLLPADRWDR